MDSFSAAAAAAAAAGSTNHHPSAVPQNAHYLAEIKYPRIADPIALDKILSVLQKIRDTTKPITYKWALIDKPKDGELFLEQKFPITRDPVNGDQFPIVDDGYLWSSIPKPEVREIQGQTIEIYRWCEGYSPGDSFFTVTKLEYRLKTPGNILFLIHYLTVKNPCVPIRPALPASKISPLYLQQQYAFAAAAAAAVSRPPPHHQVKIGQPQPPVSAALPQRTASPKLSAASGRRDDPSTQHQLQQQQQTIPPAADPSPNYFDAFTEYEATAYRFTCAKAFLTAVYEQQQQQQQQQSSDRIMNPLQMHPSLEGDLITAMEKKTAAIQERIRTHEDGHAALVEGLRAKNQEFTELCEKIKNARNEEELDALMSTITA